MGVGTITFRKKLEAMIESEIREFSEGIITGKYQPRVHTRRRCHGHLRDVIRQRGNLAEAHGNRTPLWVTDN
jgi:hypothetical protein